MTEALAAGWDLGGAHLKVALAGTRGELLKVAQLPCPLWQGLDRLDAALDQARSLMATEVETHAVTMTGELVDLFTDRREGVRQLIETMERAFSGASITYFSGADGLVGPEAAKKGALQIASANWLASAQFIAGRRDEALFLDLGSTTADVLAIKAGRVEARGMTDQMRLVSDELVYTGVTRTPVMALTDAVPFQGERQSLMAEHFATTADVHRLTGRLPAGVDLLPSADGGGKSGEESARRLARMLGLDLESVPFKAWQDLAEYLSECQLRRLHDAALRVLSRTPLDPIAPLVGAGIGRFLLQDLAGRLGRPYQDFSDLVTGDQEAVEWAASCAPAAALAILAVETAKV